MMPHAFKIIYDRQSGDDRAALDVALELGIPCGGKCPKDRRAEDGPIDSKYPVEETVAASYAFRTKCNVLESDAMFILNIGKIDGGTGLTMKFFR